MTDSDFAGVGALTPANDTTGNLGTTDLDWSDDDYEPPMPSAYPLCTNEGRCGFLEAYIWRGEEVLWESVNHMWNELCEPKALRCTAIGLAAGTGGSGKKALIPFLRRALDEAINHDLTQPTIDDYPDIHAFHEASMAFFAADYALYQKAIQKFADLMNGGPDNAPVGIVIEGRWKDKTIAAQMSPEDAFDAQSEDPSGRRP